MAVMPSRGLTTREVMARELTTKEQRRILARGKEEVGTAVSKNRPAAAKTVRPKGRHAGSDTGIGIVTPSETEGSDRGGDTVNLGLNRQKSSHRKHQQRRKQETGSHTGQHQRSPPGRVQPLWA
jgi:hypothetical protein